MEPSIQVRAPAAPCQYSTGLGERHVPRMTQAEALFLSPPLRRWVRAHETSSGCRKISVPANRRSLALEGAAADAAAAATDGWMDGSWRGVGYKVTAVSELRSHKVSARTLGLDDDDAAWQ